MIKNILQEAFILKNKGYYKHSIEAFYKALELDNTNIELLYEIAHVYFLMHNNERALNYIEQILEKEPTHIETLQLLKKIFIEKNALQEAEQTAKNIYCITKENVDLVEIFDLLNKQQKYSEIFEYAIDESNPEILYQIAYAKYYQNLLEESKTLINKAIEISIQNKYILLKGKILLKLNQDDEAMNLIQNLTFDLNDSEMLNFIGIVYQRFGEYKKAIEKFSEALTCSKTQDECYYNCASTYFKMGDINQAKKYYNLAISKNPDNQSYHFALANLYYSERNYKRALEELKNDLYESRLLKAIILYDTGYIAIAQKEFEKLNQEYPQNDIIINYINKIKNDLKI